MIVTVFPIHRSTSWRNLALSGCSEAKVLQYTISTRSPPYFSVASFAATADAAPQLNQTKILVIASLSQHSVLIALKNDAQGLRRRPVPAFRLDVPVVPAGRPEGQELIDNPAERGRSAIVRPALHRVVDQDDGGEIGRASCREGI